MEQLQKIMNIEWMKIGSPNGHRFIEITCDIIKDKLIIKDAVGNKIEFDGWIVEDYLINSKPQADKKSVS